MMFIIEIPESDWQRVKEFRIDQKEVAKELRIALGQRGMNYGSDDEWQTWLYESLEVYAVSDEGSEIIEEQFENIVIDQGA